MARACRSPMLAIYAAFGCVGLLLAAAEVRADPCVPEVAGVDELRHALDTREPEGARASEIQETTVVFGAEILQEAQLEDGTSVELSARTGGTEYLVLDAGAPFVFRLSDDKIEDLRHYDAERVRLEIRAPGWGELLAGGYLADGQRDADGELIFQQLQLELPEHAFGELSVSIVAETEHGEQYTGRVEDRKILAASSEGGSLHFGADWSQARRGTIRAGEGLGLHYDPARMTELLGGREADSITAFVSFDGGPALERPVLTTQDGERHIIVPPAAVPFGVHEVAVWFRGRTADGAEAWDSNYGRNFTSPVDVARPDANPDWRKAIFEPSFPSLEADEFNALSGYDKRYNCYAWAMGIRDQFLWNLGTATETYDGRFEALGYTPLDSLDTTYEPGVEKVALYGFPTRPGAQDSAFDWSVQHAALQRPQDEGWWTSKLGDLPLIRHRNADDVGGGSYGEVFRVYARPAQ